MNRYSFWRFRCSRCLMYKPFTPKHIPSCHLPPSRTILQEPLRDLRKNLQFYRRGPSFVGQGRQMKPNLAQNPCPTLGHLSCVKRRPLDVLPTLPSLPTPPGRRHNPSLSFLFAPSSTPAD